MAESRDEVCIFYGGSVPFVLRLVGQGQYGVVGDGYLHGFMEGEATVDGIEEQEFKPV